jgi:isopentenyl-diphosphate delta-isomerase
MEKLKAHQNGGQLHRAFSVFVFNAKGELLIQQRALRKYHCAGKWANTTCSHPREGETYLEAAHRRLQEEMGFDCPLKEKFHFIYKAEFDNGLTEWEFDRVFIGSYDGEVLPNSEEVAGVKWIGQDELKCEIEEHPETFAEWFRIIFLYLSVDDR